MSDFLVDAANQRGRDGVAGEVLVVGGDQVPAAVISVSAGQHRLDGLRVALPPLVLPGIVRDQACQASVALAELLAAFSLFPGVGGQPELDDEITALA